MENERENERENGRGPGDDPAAIAEHLRLAAEQTTAALRGREVPISLEPPTVYRP